MQLWNPTTRDVLWALAGQVLAATGTLLGIRLLTTYVDASVYGHLSLLLGIALFAKNLAFQPYLTAAGQMYTQSRANGRVRSLQAVVKRALRTVSLLAVTVSICVSLVLVSLAHPLWSAVLALGIYIMLDCSRAFELTFLAAARQQRTIAVLSNIEAWIKPIAAASAVWFITASVTSVLAGYLLAMAVTLVVCYSALNRDSDASSLQSTDLTIDRELASEVRAYSVPLMPLAVLVWITQLSDRYIIGVLRDSHEVGLYAATFGLVNFPFVLMQTVMTQALRPVHLQHLGNGHIRAARKVFLTWIISVLGLGLIGVIAFGLMNEFTARHFLGPSFRGSASMMPWIALGSAFYATSQVAGSALLAFSRPRAYVCAEAIGACLSVSITVVLVYYQGMFGAAVAFPMYCFITCLAQAALVYRLTPAFTSGSWAPQTKSLEL